MKSFSYMSLFKTSNPCGGATFDSRAIICSILVEVYKIKPHTKYQRLGPSSFRQKRFSKVLPIRVCKELAISIKKVKVNPRLSFFSNSIGPLSAMLHTKPHGHWPFGSEKEDF